jgi:uncharacterized protein YciI
MLHDNDEDTMLFALICNDKPGALQLRLETRPAHLAYLKTFEEKGNVAAGGPMLDAEGKPNGSLIILDVADIDEAREIAVGDPYAKAGLFASVDIRAWNWVFNRPAA